VNRALEQRQVCIPFRYKALVCPGAVLSEGVSVPGFVPISFGSPLREFNTCRDAKGKFCSGPRGLTGLRAPPPVTIHGRMDPAQAMNYAESR